MIAFNKKIKDAKDGLAWLDEFHGQRIVFTNGCYDLLHPGHIVLLEQAKALGDVLIVGVNSDRSVARLKGNTRPIQDEKTRLMMLAALESVDAVILFQEDTPLNLIKQLKPAILVKGGDYKLEEIVGAQEVRACGGEVHIIPFVQGFSTSRLIEKIVNTYK